MSCAAQPISETPAARSPERQARYEYEKAWRKNNRARVKEMSLRALEKLKANPEWVAKEKIRQRDNKRAKPLEAKRAAMAKFKSENPGYMRDWKRKAQQTNLHYVLTNRLRSRVGQILAGRKSAHTLMLLGCSLDQFIAHIESKFLYGMTWANRNKWHLDHIKPCKAFDLSKLEEQMKCFHHTNYQPLWAVDNMRKNTKLDYVSPAQYI